MRSSSDKFLAPALAAALLLAFMAPASAGEEGEYLSRRDTARLSAGNAPQSNIAIQHQTPWPRYLNNTAIPGNAYRGINALADYYEGPGGKDPVTNVNSINITVPPQ